MGYIVYSINDKDGNVLYYGHTKDIKKRTYQHKYSFRKGHKKSLYDHLRELNYTEDDIILIPLYNFKTKANAKRMEFTLIINNYWENDMKLTLFQKIPNLSDR